MCTTTSKCKDKHNNYVLQCIIINLLNVQTDASIQMVPTPEVTIDFKIAHTVHPCSMEEQGQNTAF